MMQLDMAGYPVETVLGVNQTAGTTQRHGFSPYEMNGGTIVGIAGDDFALIASDTRLSESYMIHSRDAPKLYTLSPKTIVGSCGFHGDVLHLQRRVEARLKMYKYEHGVEMPTSAAAAMISKLLYYKRFFPYYTYNIVAGLDNQGKGAVFSFDPVGSMEREPFRAAGSCSTQLQALLDSELRRLNVDSETIPTPALTAERAVNLIHDVFISAAERDIYTGDGVEIAIIRANAAPEFKRVQLRRD